jgi:hypothetical protein
MTEKADTPMQITPMKIEPVETWAIGDLAYSTLTGRAHVIVFIPPNGKIAVRPWIAGTVTNYFSRRSFTHDKEKAQAAAVEYQTALLNGERREPVIADIRDALATLESSSDASAALDIAYALRTYERYVWKNSKNDGERFSSYETNFWPIAPLKAWKKW